MIRRLFPGSISARLALAFALAAATVLSVAVITLALLKDSEVDIYQTNEIKSRFALFAYDVEHTNTLKDWRELHQKYNQIMSQDHGRIYIRSDSEDERYQIDAPFMIVPRHINKHHGFSKHLLNDTYYRAYSRKIPAMGERPELILSIAVDAFYYEDFAKWLDFAFNTFLLLSVSLIAIVGFILTRRNLRPVDKLSACASKISSRNLSERLPNSNLPAELHGLATSFNGVLDRLENAHHRQASFNSDVAHELRTPLGNLIGQSEVALSKPRSADELEEIMSSNLEELVRLRSIINDMLFLSHADQGEIALKRQSVSLAQEVCATAEFLEIILEENHNQLEVVGDARTEAEPNLLKRVLTNLINNASQHGSPATKIRVVIAEEAKATRLSVFNRGCAIPAADLPNLFERFYRVSKERKNSFANHGLGLSIVKAIVEVHGGSVFARAQNDEIEIGFTLPKSS